jgi:ankyrin repeat protein
VLLQPSQFSPTMSKSRGGLDQENALVKAIQRNDIAEVTRLLHSGVSPDGPSLDRPPLWYAVEADNLPAVRELLAASADIHLRNIYGETVLHEAAYHSSLPVVQALVQAGADLRARSNSNCQVIHRAAEAGRVDTVRWILEDYYFTANMSGSHGWTPLHYAAYAGQTAMVKFLLEHGADPTIRSKPGGQTASHYAARSEQNETGEWTDDATLVRDLIEYGADVNLPADARCLSTSTETGESLHELLFDARPDEPPPELVYPIHGAVLSGMLSKVEALLEAGAGINARTSVHGSTPLHLAARRGGPATVCSLLRRDPDTESRRWELAHQDIVA